MTEVKDLIATNIANDVILPMIREMPVICKEDQTFLVEHKEQLGKVFEKTHMWRTKIQKLSIISDDYCPTLHGKFHQAILECKVQTDQLFYLMKDFEMAKLDCEILEEEIRQLREHESRMDDLFAEKKELELKFKQYELKQQQIAANYRMDEIKDWVEIQESLMQEMKEHGMTEDEIWSKNAGEVENMFFLTLTNLHGLSKSTDGAEANNLVALAKFSVQQAKELGIFNNLVVRCNQQQIQSLQFLGEMPKK
jgi:hypothetical protein